MTTLGVVPANPVRVTDPNLTPVPLAQDDFMLIKRIKSYDMGKDVSGLMEYYNQRKRAESFVAKHNLDYEKEDISSFSALASKKMSHLPLDESGTFSSNAQKNKAFDTELVAACAAYYRKFVPSSQESGPLTVPRSKNLGWPTFFPGVNRLSNDIALYLTVIYALDRKDKGYSLDEVLSELQPAYGQAYNKQGTRRQHNSKDIGFYDRGSFKGCPRLEGKVRAILFGSKISLVFNRSAVKRMLKGMLKTPVHTQDRSRITASINKMYSSGRTIFAIDHSKFDRHNGFDKALSGYDIIGKALSLDPADLKREFMTPSRLVGSTGAYMLAAGATMPSGISSTTVINCAAAFAAAVYVASKILVTSYSDAISRLDRDWNLLAWGDDNVLCIDSDIQTISKFYAEIGFEVAEEPALKYLGMLYPKPSSSRYSMASLIRNSIQPERPRTKGALLQLGLAGRKKLIDSSLWEDFVRDFGRDMIRFVQDDFEIDFSCSEDSVIRATNWVEKNISNEINSLDEIFYSLSSGNEDATFSSLLGLDLSSLDSLREKEVIFSTLEHQFERFRFDPNTLANRAQFDRTVSSVSSDFSRDKNGVNKLKIA